MEGVSISETQGCEVDASSIWVFQVQVDGRYTGELGPASIDEILLCFFFLFFQNGFFMMTKDLPS